MEKRGKFKFILLIIILGALVYFARYTNVLELLSRDAIHAQVEATGIWAPVVFVLIFGAGTAIFLPGSVFIALGGFIFGTTLGTALNVLGHILGAFLTFYFVKFLGRDFVQGLKSPLIQKYNHKLRHKGFATVFYLRLCFCPFAILNTAAGLSSIRFRDFILGTSLGVIPTTFILTFFFDQITGIQTVADLLQPEIGISLLLLGSAFLLPRAMKNLPEKYKKRLGFD